MTKLTTHDHELIAELAKIHMPRNQIAEKFDVAPQTVSKSLTKWLDEHPNDERLIPRRGTVAKSRFLSEMAEQFGLDTNEYRIAKAGYERGHGVGYANARWHNKSA